MGDVPTHVLSSYPVLSTACRLENAAGRHGLQVCIGSRGAQAVGMHTCRGDSQVPAPAHPATWALSAHI